MLIELLIDLFTGDNSKDSIANPICKNLSRVNEGFYCSNDYVYDDEVFYLDVYDFIFDAEDLCFDTGNFDAAIDTCFMAAQGISIIAQGCCIVAASLFALVGVPVRLNINAGNYRHLIIIGY